MKRPKRRHGVCSPLVRSPAELTKSQDRKVHLKVLRAEVRRVNRESDPETPEDSYHKLSDLLKIEAETTTPKSCPRVLPLDSIKRAEKVFQHRLSVNVDWLSPSLISQIARSIKDSITQGTKLDMAPLLVVAVGSEWYLVDGHHRHAAYLTAYKATGCKKPVRVEVFDGNVTEARIEAIRRNGKSQRALDTRSRAEATWGLVKQGLEHKDIHEITTTSLRSIGRMAAMLREHPEYADWTWDEAREGTKRTQSDADKRANDHTRAKEMSDRLRSKMGPKFPYSARILVLALEHIHEELPGLLQEALWERQHTMSNLELLDI
jgi:hypothetical protein